MHLRHVVSRVLIARPGRVVLMRSLRGSILRRCRGTDNDTETNCSRAEQARSDPERVHGPSLLEDTNGEEGSRLETKWGVEHRKAGRAVLEPKRSRESRPLLNRSGRRHGRCDQCGRCDILRHRQKRDDEVVLMAARVCAGYERDAVARRLMTRVTLTV